MTKREFYLAKGNGGIWCLEKYQEFVVIPLMDLVDCKVINEGDAFIVANDGSKLARRFPPSYGQYILISKGCMLYRLEP